MSRLFSAPSALRTATRDVARSHYKPSFTRCAPPTHVVPSAAVTTNAHHQPHSRSFSSLPTLRPSTSAPASIFARRPTTCLLLQQPSFFTTPSTTTTATAADLVPTSAISSHPALLQSQIRCGPRPYSNMNRPSRLIRNRRSGFLTRMKTKDGRKTIARRRAKGRKRLGAA